MPLGEVVVRFVLELLLTATLVGGVSGWLIARKRRSAAAMAIAGVAFALGPGHNIPFLGGTSGALKGAVILIVVVLVSALTLVGAHQVLAKGRGPRSSGSVE